jgi:hypothetical protein
MVHIELHDVVLPAALISSRVGSNPAAVLYIIMTVEKKIIIIGRQIEIRNSDCYEVKLIKD